MAVNNNDIKNRNFEDKTGEFLTNATSKLVSFIRDIIHRLKDSAEKAEEEKQAWLDEQKRRNAYLNFMKIQRYVQNLMATALNTMPAHLIFYGIISPHNLFVTLTNNGIIRVCVPCDLSNAPYHFHVFRDELQNVLDSLYRTAIDTLRNHIMSDAWYVQSATLSNQWTANEERRLLQDYHDLYISLCERLFKVTVISVQRQSSGFSVDIRAVFNDCGLHHDNYFTNLRLVF